MERYDAGKGVGRGGSGVLGYWIVFDERRARATDYLPLRQNSWIPFDEHDHLWGYIGQKNAFTSGKVKLLANLAAAP